MKIERNDIRDKINHIIADIIEREDSNFEENANLINDLEFDSMCYLELSVQIQREYGVIISAQEWERIKTLKELYDVIVLKLNTNEQA
ncbi:MAG: acyl carrier protein [Dysgonamonadaceae bacterium]|jgi:acyl carrier protein|nr:acyl carrier protein [Dysgonamonadaceae bacterium]